MLNGPAAKYDFGNQTEGLVYDIFVLNMAYKQVQEKLCTEPKDHPAEALQFALAFEGGLKRQRTYENINQEQKIKEKPVCSVSGIKPNNRECRRCGALRSRLSKSLQNTQFKVQLLRQKGSPGKGMQSEEK